MAGKRSAGKRNFGGYILAALYGRVTTIAKSRDMDHTEALTEALTDWADKHTPETTTEQQS